MTRFRSYIRLYFPTRANSYSWSHPTYVCGLVVECLVLDCCRDGRGFEPYQRHWRPSGARQLPVHCASLQYHFTTFMAEIDVFLSIPINKANILLSWLYINLSDILGNTHEAMTVAMAMEDANQDLSKELKTVAVANKLLKKDCESATEALSIKLFRNKVCFFSCQLACYRRLYFLCIMGYFLNMGPHSIWLYLHIRHFCLLKSHSRSSQIKFLHHLKDSHLKVFWVLKILN